METEQLHADAGQIRLHRDLEEFLAFLQSLTLGKDTLKVQLLLQGDKGQSDHQGGRKTRVIVKNS